MEAMATNCPIKIGGIANTGLITNLPSAAVVEVPCLVDKSGIAPTVLRALPEQRDPIDHAANLLGKKPILIMLKPLMSVCRALCWIRFISSLDADKFQKFIDLPDAPPKHNPGLERLFALKALWDKA